MNATSKDIAEILDGDSSLGLTLGTDLFMYRMPATPDDLVVVRDNPGRAPMLQYSQSRSNYYYSSVTVWVRNTDYGSGYAVAQSILEYLHATGNVTINSTNYQLIRAEGDVQLLHFDENDRAVFITNYEVQRKSV